MRRMILNNSAGRIYKKKAKIIRSPIRNVHNLSSYVDQKLSLIKKVRHVKIIED